MTLLACLAYQTKSLIYWATKAFFGVYNCLTFNERGALDSKSSSRGDVLRPPVLHVLLEGLPAGLLPGDEEGKRPGKYLH